MFFKVKYERYTDINSPEFFAKGVIVTETAIVEANGALEAIAGVQRQVDCFEEGVRVQRYLSVTPAKEVNIIKYTANASVKWE